MTASTQSLAERHARLIAKSQVLREDLAAHWSAAEPRLASIDAGLSAVGRWVRTPAGIGITFLIAVALGRKRSLQAATAGLGLISTAWQIYSALSYATSKVPRA